jgi:hypothetical protein
MPFVIGAILIIVGAAVYALWKKGVLSGLLADAKPEQVKMPYRKKDYLLSKAERSFYEVLTQCVGPDLAIFSKIRILDLVFLAKGTENAQGLRNRVQSKHVDFVLCRRDTLSPVLVIELNDKSHDQQKTRERDEFVGRVFASAGLPLLTVRAQAAYDTRELVASIRASLSVLAT